MSYTEHSSISLPCQPGSVDTGAKGEDTTATGAEQSLTTRYSAPALAAGFTAIPNVVLDQHTALGISAAELTFAQHVTRYQCDLRAPFPAERTLAARMGKTTRQIRNYSASLRRKGFLRVIARFSPATGRQTSNAYDFTPLIEAAVVLATAPPALSDSRAAVPSSTACPEAMNSSVETAPLVGNFHPPRTESSTLGEEDIREKEILIRCPQPPVTHEEDGCGEAATACQSSVRLLPTLLAQEARNANASTNMPAGDDADPEADALAPPLAALGQRLGDRCPSASLTRAVRLLHATGLSVGEFVRLLEEAARRTLAASKQRRVRRPQPGKLMAYLFAVLENLLHAPLEPAPRRTMRRRAASLTSATALSSSPAPPDDDVSEPEREEQHPLWRAVLEEFRATMTADNVARCARAHVLEQDGDLLRLVVPDTFHLHWLERLHRRIEETLALLGHAGVRMTFQLAPQAA